MKKLDIMNMREGEEWIIVDGKETRLEKKIIVTDSVDKDVIKKIAKTLIKIVDDIPSRKERNVVKEVIKSKTKKD